MRKTGNWFRKRDEKPRFSERKWLSMEDLSEGPSGRTAAIPIAWWFNRGSRFFKTHIVSRPFKERVLIVVRWQDRFFSSRDGVIWVTPSLREKALYRGAVAAQAAHNCCPWYSFLLLGHNPHFFSHWKFASTLGLFFTRNLVKKICQKKKVWRHGRLWRPTWPDRPG